MTEEEMWNNDNPIRDLDIDVPEWIDQDITPNTVAAIVQGGCASGAYMPAVTYHEALDTMNQYGDDSNGPLAYLEDHLGELPQPKPDESWAGMACFFLSAAVETWAMGAYDELEEWEPEEISA